MDEVSSISELMSSINLIIPKNSKGEFVVSPEYCQKQLIIFLKRCHLKYYVEDDKIIIHQLNVLEKWMYQGMFTSFVKEKLQGKPRLDAQVRIEIT